MTREEKLADEVWYYIHRYVDAMSAKSNLRAISEASKTIDRKLIKALRSKKK